MIVTGFFQQVFDRITIECVRDVLVALIARQVPSDDGCLFAKLAFLFSNPVR